ncbi:MAG: hypothetical protein NC340_09175 [Ruminococcus flavefaciens]|nr:hypothetical protein [Ruminococcus flavefaciens]MCM1230602.1 hypothetical protein [Ruminococcus flavefaciens]
MINEIRDELCRIGEKVSREELFALSPVYLLSDVEENGSYLHYFMDDLCLDLEKSEIFSSKSHIFLGLSLAYNRQEGQSGLYNDSGIFKAGLENWLAYISKRNHYDSGVVMIDIRNFKDIPQDCLWWKQFFTDIQRYKKDFLFFVSCGESDVAEIQNLLEKEVFTVRHNLTAFTADDYFDWFIAQMNSGFYSVLMTNPGKKLLKKLLTKYERDLSYHILNIWLVSLLWNFFKNGYNSEILPVKYLSEDLLVQTIEKCRKSENSSEIGFK